MGQGRKKKPTQLKKLQGTLKAERVLENEMQVSLVSEIPFAPEWLTEIGSLHGKGMLHHIDLRLIEAYCNAMALHIETEMMLREKGRIQVFKNPDGTIKHTQAIPYQKIANDALDRALKLATQFGLTPSSRTSIQQPTLIQQNNEYNFFD